LHCQRIVENKHAVNDVHHAVGGSVVRCRDVGIFVDTDMSAIFLNLDLPALHSFELLFLLEVLAEDGRTSHHVVLENGIQLFDVLWLQQILQDCRVEVRECLVRWGEDCERSFALQRGHELAGFKGSHERGEVLDALGEGDDVFGRHGAGEQAAGKEPSG